MSHTLESALYCGHCVAVRCSVLQCVAVCCSVHCIVNDRVIHHDTYAVCCIVLQCAAVCCSVLQCVAEYCDVLQYCERLPAISCVTHM